MLTNLSDLSKSDLVSLSEIVYLSTSVRKKEELGDLLRVVTHLIPTTGVVAGLPSKDPRHDSIIETERYMNVSYSISWLTLYQERKFHLVDVGFHETDPVISRK